MALTDTRLRTLKPAKGKAEVWPRTETASTSAFA